MNPLEAKLLESFGNLSFGSSTKEAEKFFGPSEETEELDGIDGSNSTVWHYWGKGFSLFFDKETGRFSCVEVDNTVPLILWEIPIFKLTEPELKALLSKKGYKDLDEEHHEWGEKRITFDDAMADFYFENGILVSVNYGKTVSGISENNN